MFDQIATDTDIDWNSVTRKEWDSLLSRAPFAAFQQSYGFGEVIRAHQGEVFRARIFANSECVGLAQVHTRRLARVAKLATLMLGPVWLKPDVPADVKASAYRHLKSSLPVKGPHAFLLMPGEADDTPTEMGLKQVVSPYHTALLDLTVEQEALLAGLDGKWRNRLRAAEKSNVRVSPLGRTEKQYGWLLDEELKQQRRSGYKALPPILVPAWQAEEGQKSVYGWEAREGTNRVAGMLCLMHGSTATYHIGWANETGRRASAMNLLLWTAITSLRKKGAAVFDLGGIDTDKGDGLARFKLGTGATLLSQPGTFLLRAGWR